MQTPHQFMHDSSTLVRSSEFHSAVWHWDRLLQNRETGYRFDLHICSSLIELPEMSVCLSDGWYTSFRSGLAALSIDCFLTLIEACVEEGKKNIFLIPQYHPWYFSSLSSAPRPPPLSGSPFYSQWWRSWSILPSWSSTSYLLQQLMYSRELNWNVLGNIY